MSLGLGAPATRPLPAGNGSSGDLTAGADSNLWFTENSADSSAIGRITPSGAIDEFLIPAGHEAPYSLTAGPDGNPWFTGFTYGLGRIGRNDPAPPKITGVVAVADWRMAITSILLRFDEAPDPAPASKVRSYGLAAAVASGQTIVYSKWVKIAGVVGPRGARGAPQAGRAAGRTGPCDGPRRVRGGRRYVELQRLHGGRHVSPRPGEIRTAEFRGQQRSSGDKFRGHHTDLKCPRASC